MLQAKTEKRIVGAIATPQGKVSFRLKGEAGKRTIVKSITALKKEITGKLPMKLHEVGEIKNRKGEPTGKKFVLTAGKEITKEKVYRLEKEFGFVPKKGQKIIINESESFLLGGLPKKLGEKGAIEFRIDNHAKQLVIGATIIPAMYRGLGIIEIMVEEIEEICRKKKITSIISLTHKNNKGMGKVFEKLGFKEIGQVMDKDPWNIFYEKILSKKT